MTDEQRRIVDRRAAAWLEDGPTAAPDQLLAEVLERTSHTSQRAGWLATLLGAPSDPSSAIRARKNPRLILVATLLTLATVLAAALVAGSLRRSDDLVVAPIGSPTPSHVVVATHAPNGTPDSSGPPPLDGTNKTFLVKDSAGLFSALIPETWHARPTEDGSVAMATRYVFLPSWDVVPVQVLSIATKAEDLPAAQAEIFLQRGDVPVFAMTVNGDPALLIAEHPPTRYDPVALIEHGGLVYRIRVSDIEVPGAGESILRQFLVGFHAAGPPTADSTYRSEAGTWQFVAGAANMRFSPPLVTPGAATFAGPACAGLNPSACGSVVTVQTSTVSSDTRIPLPDGSVATLSGRTLTAIAAEWETAVGTSRGSSTVMWDGSLVYNVDNVSVAALFVIRGDERLVVVADDLDGGDDPLAPCCPAYDVLDQFLAGFDLLP